MRIDTKLNDIDKQADRLKRYINYFAKEIRADKIILSLLCCVYIFVVLIIIGFILPDKSGDSSDLLTKLKNDHGMNSTTNNSTTNPT